ncbi:hypothetical protein BT96DRAFT_43158 [Gymnopus androsaceus JB14]|uniref:Uncharacterized protein n=1 Tax=Gymnopus androsaceus JB14 TaxID=1447944 RepID=A0A6A4HM63_9AGAR|nr:hypothetical protein BT96DRAFT_43158 [Gymnopus androsaceus JB14]
MANDSSPSQFLQLAREMRDEIYDALLFIETRSQSPHVTDASYTPPLSQGSCFGVLYSCRQIYTEMLESIERHAGLSFWLELAVADKKSSQRKLPHVPARTWIALPLWKYPKLHSIQSDAHSKCRNLHVSFRIQTQKRLQWIGDGGIGGMTTSLFGMLAKFLLHGPLGLHSDASNRDLWDIDTLSVNVVGRGTSFTDYDGQVQTVPDRIIEETERNLSKIWMNMLCTSGALSGRVRVVKFLENGQVKREWLIDQEKCLSVEIKEEWAQYGWVIE